METNIKKNNRELIKKYASELAKYQTNSQSEDFELIHYCLSRVIMDSEYLDELLDGYICCGEHEKLGYNENVKGDASKGIDNVKNYSHELSMAYFGLREAIQLRIIDKLKNSTEEEKEIFDEMMKKEYKNAVLEGKKYDEEISYLIDNANYKVLLESRMAENNISRQKADLQLAYDTNYACGEFVKCNGKKEALTLLMSRIKEYTADEELEENNKPVLK